jgi:hypothetical protein
MAWQMNVDASAIVVLIVGAALAVGSGVEPARTLRAFLVGSVGTKGAAIAYRTLGAVACVLAVTLGIASLPAGTYNPFIYFRF